MTTILAVMGFVHGIPMGLLASLCYVESSHRPNIAVNDNNGHLSVGLCQIQLQAASEVGYLGDEHGLFDPVVNAEFAAKYLVKQKLRYGNWDQAVIAYNRGNSIGITTSKYQRKVMHIWKTKKFR